MNKKNENKARSDGSKGEHHPEQGQRQTKHDWDDTGDGDDKTKVQMTDDERDVAKYRALVARISNLSQDRPDLKFVAMQVCCAMATPSASDLELVRRIGR